MTEKIAVMFLFVCLIKVIRRPSLNVVPCQVQKNKQKHVTESCSRLHDHSTLLAFDKHANSKNKKPPSQLGF